MHTRIADAPNLTERDVALLHRIETGLLITADVSRADVLLCCILEADQILVAHHARPRSISSIYLNDSSGRLFTADEQPVVHRALLENRGGSRRKQVLSSGAPIIQQVYPIHNAADRVIAAMLVETNMIEYERHRRRDKPFRRAVHWLQEMAIRGEIEIPTPLRGFGPLDGIYLVDDRSCILYMSGIATNLFRSVGLVKDMRGRHVSSLEELDEKVVQQTIQANRCVEQRTESEEGRVWIRTAIPLRAPPGSWPRLQRQLQQQIPWMNRNGDPRHQVDGALVLVHNATEQVQKERELNVKSAMIQEVHHRVKNNLQSIAAILRIQARRCESQEAVQHLTDAVNRILSMSVIHEYLSQDEHQPINVRDVCHRIAGQAQQVAISPAQEVEIKISGPNIRLPAGQATAVALVVNELLLNAIEHGLGDRSSGVITLELTDLGDAVRFTVEDDGHGLPDDFELGQSRSLGLQITRTLVTDDLKGRLTFEPIHDSNIEGSRPEKFSGAQQTANATRQHLAGTRAVVVFPKRSVPVSEQMSTG